MKKFGSIVIAALALTIIAGIATAALAATNQLTKEPIAENIRLAKEEAQRKVFPAADSFVETSLTVNDSKVTYSVAQKNGTPIGYVFTTVSRGKSSGLTVMTGVDMGGTVVGVEVVQDNETAGYIDKVKDGGLLNALIGKQSTDGVDSVSQATKTSTGVLNAVEEALEYFALIE